jgi:hypothetical protein
MKKTVTSKFTPSDNTTDADRLAAMVQWKDENSENPDFQQVLKDIDPFVKVFHAYGEGINKVANTFNEKVVGLGPIIVERLASWVANGKTREQAEKIVRKHFTVALSCSGASEYTVKRYLTLLEDADGKTVFTPRPPREASKDSVAVKASKAVDRMIADKISLSDVITAWIAAEGDLGSKAILIEGMATLGLAE